MKIEFIKWVFEQRHGSLDFAAWLDRAKTDGSLYQAAGLTYGDGAFLGDELATCSIADYKDPCGGCGYNCRLEEDIPCCICSNMDHADKDGAFYADHYLGIEGD